MKGMMDATCPRCKKHIGWFGKVTDRPPCPECGHQINIEVLKSDEAKVAKAREEILRDLKEEERGQ